MYKSIDDLRKIKKHFFFQVLSAIVFMAFVLMTMSFTTGHSQLLWAVGAGSIASTSFIIFTIPQSVSARSSRIVGGYAIAIIVGLLIHYALMGFFSLLTTHFVMSDPRIFWMTASVSVGISMILMVLFDCQHPPAAGIALVLVLDIHGFGMLFIIMFAALALSLIKLIFNDKLINLVG